MREMTKICHEIEKDEEGKRSVDKEKKIKRYGHDVFSLFLSSGL